LQHKQILIPGHNDLCLSVHGYFQNLIILYIPAIVNGMKDDEYLDDLSQHLQKFFQVLDADVGIKLLPS